MRSVSEKVIIAEVARAFCEKYAPHEVALLELNSRNLDALVRTETSDPKPYSDAPGAGIQSWSCYQLLYLLGRIADEVIADVFTFTRARLVAYVCESEARDLESLGGNNETARVIVSKLRHMLCNGDKVVCNGDKGQH